MKEKEIEKEFKKIKKQMIKIFPTTTDNMQLNNFCRKLFKSKFIGVFPCDKVKKLRKNQSCILNLDPSYMGGSHWCALARDSNNKLYFYDSFARPLKKIIPILKTIFKGETIYNDTKDTEQRKTTNVCGALCVSWLICFYKYGGSNAIKI